MKISSRFSIAVHTLVCICRFNPEFKVTSDFIAGSVQVNPVVIRRTLSKLKNAGLIEIARGTGGTVVAKSPAEITLFDIYQAVDSVEDSIFSFHENPNPNCPVGGNIHHLLDGRLKEAQQVFENQLAQTTLQDLLDNLKQLEG